MFKNSNLKYGIIHIALHWITAIMIVALLVIGLYMKSIPFNPNIYFLHKSCGFAVFILVIIRLFWKFVNPSPEFDTKISKKVQILTKLGTVGLYGFLILMPLSGILMSLLYGVPVPFFGFFQINPMFEINKTYAHFFEEIHEAMVPMFIILILVHSVMALVHHFIFKDNTLKKMLP